MTARSQWTVPLRKHYEKIFRVFNLLNRLHATIESYNTGRIENNSYIKVLVKIRWAPE